MDHDEQMNHVQQIDPAAAAVIVKSIADIERNHQLAEGPVSDQLMAEIETTMRKAATEPWEVSKSGWTILLTAPDWKPTKGLGRGDAWFEINEIADDEDEQHTWIGAAVRAGKSTLGLELVFRKGLAQAAVDLMREKAQSEKLAKIGFNPDASADRWFVPIVIDRMRLAKGYSENDLTEALVPAGKAVTAAVAAKPDLDAMIALVRTQAKSK